MKRPILRVGRLFAVPLLRGGFACGCITGVRTETAGLACIFAGVADTLALLVVDGRNVIIEDVLISSDDFVRHEPTYDPWVMLPQQLPSPPQPRETMMKSGSPGRFILFDFLERAPSRPLRDDEASRYSYESWMATDGKVADIEVVVRRLNVDADEYYDSWVRDLATTTEPSTKPTPSDKYAPCHLVDGERSTLSMPIPASTISTFEAQERQGSGYDWTEVVRFLVRKHEPGLGRQLRYDPEADTFAVSSKSKPALAKVAKLIRKAIANQNMLAEAVSKTEID